VRRFDARSLHDALDEQRQGRGITWTELAEEIGVSVSTIRRTRLGGRMEVDGMLAMVGWLNRPVEDFVREE
jgi:transcriptional regulator with XRE-family HTH domain